MLSDNPLMCGRFERHRNVKKLTELVTGLHPPMLALGAQHSQPAADESIFSGCGNV